jgi:hypothetical protein
MLVELPQCASLFLLPFFVVLCVDWRASERASACWGNRSPKVRFVSISANVQFNSQGIFVSYGSDSVLLRIFFSILDGFSFLYLLIIMTSC